MGGQGNAYKYRPERQARIQADMQNPINAHSDLKAALEEARREAERSFETIRHYIHLQLGKPKIPHLPSAIEGSLDTAKSHVLGLLTAALSKLEGGK